MIHHEFIGKYQIIYIRASEPFSLNELYALLTSTPGDAPLEQALGSVVLDLRQVHLDKFEEPEIRRHLMRKATLGAEITNFPCAYVVKGLKGYSQVRLASIFADLSGVISEENVFITEDLGAAIEWSSNGDTDGIADLVASLEAQKTSTYII